MGRHACLGRISAPRSGDFEQRRVRSVSAAFLFLIAGAELVCDRLKFIAEHRPKTQMIADAAAVGITVFVCCAVVGVVEIVAIFIVVVAFAIVIVRIVVVVGVGEIYVIVNVLKGRRREGAATFINEEGPDLSLCQHLAVIVGVEVVVVVVVVTPPGGLRVSHPLH